MNNRWLYIDFNSYFASVEQQIDPFLRKKPVAVVPVMTDSTCAIAASYEAKAFGVKTGTPIYEAKKLCPDLICVLAKHQVYIEFHEKILQEIDKHVPVSKVCSIDEMACELLESEQEKAIELAYKIKKGLKEHVGESIGCSIGIAPNAYLAKVATDMQKPDGLISIYEEDLPEKLYPLKLKDLPGIGENMEMRLRQRGVFDVKTLCSLDLIHMRMLWGSNEGERMWHHLRGIDLPDRKTQRRSLGHSQVLAPDLRDPQTARMIGKRLVVKAASRLRRMKMVASKMSIWVRLEERIYFDASVSVDRIEDTVSFLKGFSKMWEEIIKKVGLRKIKKISIHFSKLESAESSQYELFADHSKEKRKAISKTLDKINQRYGKDSVCYGPLLSDPMAGTKIAFTRIPDKEEFFE